MKNTDLVEKLFPTEDVTVDITSEGPSIFTDLGKRGINNLAYGDDLGSNPGYIFRGELDFDRPLQSSLERRLHKTSNSKPVTAEILRSSEKKIIEDFIKGDGGRVSAIDGSSRSREEIVWWMSVMQHYRHPTRLVDFTRDIRIALFFAVEHYFKWLSDCGESRDLFIYCFPCKDPKHRHDSDNNKSPFRAIATGIDMNLALGCQIGLEWMGVHNPTFDANYKNKAHQLWGWDRPYYENVRLRYQKGMFMYPYEYPQGSIIDSAGSWLVNNFAMNESQIHLGTHSRSLNAKRLKIAGKYAEDLKIHLKDDFGLTPATVYVDFEKAGCEPGNYYRP